MLMLMLALALQDIFGVQLYKNNARALLSHILSILNLDWLQHAHSVRGVYECKLILLVYIPSYNLLTILLFIDCSKNDANKNQHQESHPGVTPKRNYTW